MIGLGGRCLLKDTDLTRTEFLSVLDLSVRLREEKRSNHEERRLVGRNIALIFEKTSTRTRAAFEIARLHNRVIRSVPFCAERNWPWRKETALPIMHEERAADTWSKVGVRPQPSVQPHLALLAAICSGVGCSV